MKGFGTVVTGTLISGTVHKEQELEVHPTGKRLRVRGVQVHGAAADEAIAGQRTALNLAGVETAELARGMMLTPPRNVSANTPRQRDARSVALGQAAARSRARSPACLHGGDHRRGQPAGRETVAAGRVGTGAAEARRSSAAVARRPLHHPAVLSGDHDRRRTCAGCGRGASADQGCGSAGVSPGDRERATRTSRWCFVWRGGAETGLSISPTLSARDRLVAGRSRAACQRVREGRPG